MLNHDGTAIPGFPTFLDDTGHTGTTSPTPAIGDPDGDGLSEIFAASTFSTVMLIDQPGSDFPAAYRWPTFRQSSANGGLISLPLTVVMDPINPPIIIPASGGNFEYHFTLSNQVGMAQTFHAWISVPPLGWGAPIVGPINLTLPPHASLERTRMQLDPAGLPAGTYTYVSWVGIYPTPWQSDYFPFTKLASGDGGVKIDSWENTASATIPRRAPFRPTKAEVQSTSRTSKRKAAKGR